MGLSKKKRLLFIAPDYYGFDEVVLSGFQNYSDYEVTMIVTNQSFKYNNFGERVVNFFSKLLLGKNMKKTKKDLHHIRKINLKNSYDLLVVNRPDMLSDELISIATAKSIRSIVVFWDSFAKIDGQKETISKYDTCFSIDRNDCDKYKLNKIHNFYFVEETIDNPEHDVFYLGTLDNRYNMLKDILTSLEKKGMNAKARLYSHDPAHAITYADSNISFMHQIIPFAKSYHFNQNTKVILDLKHDNQVGLSFRPFEAMGMRKKIISTNEQIIHYDFYNPNNIFIWTKDTFEVPADFFTTPYEELPQAILIKYSIQNWVKEILTQNKPLI